MDNFCGSPFWISNLTWNISSQPDFSPCFQDSALALFPCFFLWLLTPLHVITVYMSERRYVPVTLLNSFKIFLSLVLSILSLAEYIDAYSSESTLPLVYYVTPAVRTLTYILVLVIVIFNRSRGVHTSALLFLFWIFSALVYVINFRSLLRSAIFSSPNIPSAEWKLSELVYTTRIVSAFIVIVQLVLSCIADKKAQDPFIMIGHDYGTSSPEYDASILSKLTFSWLDSLMWLGYKRALNQGDLYSIKNKFKSDSIAQRFDSYLDIQIEKAAGSKTSLFFEPDLGTCSKHQNINDNPNTDASFLTNTRTQQDINQPAKYVGIVGIIVKTFWPTLLLASTCKLIASLLTFASPILLDYLITFVRSSDEPEWRGLLYAFSLFALSVVDSIFMNKQEYLTSVNTMLIRTSLTSAIYRKTLRISNQGRKSYTTGQIVNLMAVDTQRISDIALQINNLWSAPLQLTLALVLLYQQLGVAIFAGLFIMAINVPFNAWIAIRMRCLQQAVMKFKDNRIKLLSEIFNGIKIIKIHAWESAFKTRIENIRHQEISSLTKQTWYSAAITFSFVCLPFAVALTSFAFYVLIDSTHVLDANKVFVSLSLFNIIRIPLALLPMIITNLSMSLVSIDRINKYLETDEVDAKAVEQIEDDSLAAKIEDATFKWDQNGETILKDIDIRIPKRKLLAVVGTVGSGKSSLLSAILGNMEKTSGKVSMDLNSSVSYVPQEAWILNSSLKDNIVFNKVVKEDHYRKVIDACALGPDLKILPQGDQSDAVNMSGGQKQRVSLARAIYADSDIYLLDDPLNAVDAHVSRHIFNQIIGPKGMLRDRTRVLVTNKLSFLPEVDYIFVMKDGRVHESGTYETLLSNKGVLSDLILKYLLENLNKVDISMNEDIRLDMISKELKRIEALQEVKESEKENVEAKVKQENTTSPSTAKADPKENQEVTQIGSVGLDVHLKFIKTMGMGFVIAQSIYVLSSIFTLASNIWLSEWANDANNVNLRNNTSLRDTRLGVYAVLGIGESVLIIISTILLNIACIQSSKILHNNMLDRILRAPMSWFNVVPSGRIINRFSKDVDTVDLTIRFNVRMLTVIALRTVCSLILISIGSPFSIIFIIPIVLLYFLFQIFYVSTSRQLKRIESASKSPIYSHFSETIAGTSSIRAFKIVQEFIFELNHRVDTNNISFYTGCVASRWLAIRLEFLGYIVVLIASLIAVLSRGTISPGIAGLSVTYALSITTVMSMLVRVYSDYETNVVSVERLIEYTKTPVEPEEDEEPFDPNWPARGEISFDNYSTKYRPELDLVLRKFNLHIDPAEKVGLVGRTGAGKSSVALALFRVVEPVEGQIVIDNVDISHIDLRVLRSKLSIIPQEPFLFTGTIRLNIDPQDAYSDEELWRALELAHLGQFVNSLEGRLEHEVNEGGSNFSIGQKQLFCLARTLLRRSRILVLDEATASVDVETDDLIQKTIRSEFKGSTILTIAHRLETINDYDRVVVMDSGSAIEQGSPASLLKNPKSVYSSLAKDMQ